MSVVTLDQKTNEAFYHEFTYYEPDGTTPKDITSITITVEIRDKNNNLIQRFTEGSGLTKVTPASGIYSLLTAVAVTTNWTVGLAKSDIVYLETREESTVTFYVNIIDGVTRA